MVETKGLAKLVSRDATSITVEVLGVKEIYDTIKVLEFTSERKMMSVIMRNRESGETQVFAKGASDSMATRLVEGGDSSPDLPLADKFAGEGLRTLSFSLRKIDESEGMDFDTCTTDQVEANLNLVGITAVEDLLQDDVAECI